MSKLYLLKTSLFSLILGSPLLAEDTTCPITPKSPCYSSDCPTCPNCLGPEKVNPPARPISCGGDWEIILSAIYWNANQEGMQYALRDQVFVPISDPDPVQVSAINNLISAKYETPHFDWDFGFKFGIGYNSTYDGWDLSVLWTNYKGRAFSHVVADLEDNQVFVTLWSAFESALRSITYATDIRSHWKIDLNLADIALGREFWISRWMTLRPYLGIRLSSIDQDYRLNHRGGSFTARFTTPTQNPYRDEVCLKNNFKGVGPLLGLDSLWNLGSGWALFGKTAFSTVYGHFSIKHREKLKKTVAPFEKLTILETENRFRASRFMTDLSLGIEWATLLGDCQSKCTIGLAWEHHLFLNQNQMWSIIPSGGVALSEIYGENSYFHRSGDLAMQGWSLTLVFDF